MAPDLPCTRGGLHRHQEEGGVLNKQTRRKAVGCALWCACGALWTCCLMSAPQSSSTRARRYSLYCSY